MKNKNIVKTSKKYQTEKWKMKNEKEKEEKVNNEEEKNSRTNIIEWKTVEKANERRKKYNKDKMWIVGKRNSQQRREISGRIRNSRKGRK